MRVVINEDIIRNALNESVDEFMLEEGMRDAWNAFRNNKWVNGIWNGVRNGVANYMDWATNGQWNKKYNVYPDATQKSIRSKGPFDYIEDRLKEQRCLMTWFKVHAANVEKILHYKEGPNHSLYGKRNFFNSSVWMGVTGATAYIEQYCTYDNFVDYVRQYFSDFQGNEYIEQYIGKYVQSISDSPLKCLQNLNINKFVSSPEGNKYYKQTQKERNAYYDTKSKEEADRKQALDAENLKKQQDELNKKIEALKKLRDVVIPNYANWIGSINGRSWYLWAKKNITANNSFDKNFKEWLLNVLDENQLDQAAAVKNITYNNFISQYGDRYDQNVLNAVKP